MVRMSRAISWSTGLAAGLVLGFLSACGGQNDSRESLAAGRDYSVQDSFAEPVMIFDTLEHDFGTIIEGERVVGYFDYKNGGGEDLLITSVESSCGCTTPGWSSKPLKPGERGRLEVIFDGSIRKCKGFQAAIYGDRRGPEANRRDHRSQKIKTVI